MKKKLLSILLSLAMVITMLPMTTFVSSAIGPDIEVYIGDQEATEFVDYEWDSNTLKIYSSGLTLTGEKMMDTFIELNSDVTSLGIKNLSSDGSIASFETPEPTTPMNNFTLNVEGNNTVENGYDIINGVSSTYTKKITISGDGTLAYSGALNIPAEMDFEITGNVTLDCKHNLSSYATTFILSNKAKLVIDGADGSTPLEIYQANFIVRDEADLTVKKGAEESPGSAISAYSCNFKFNSKGTCKIINETEDKAISFNSSTINVGENTGLLYITGYENNTTYSAYSYDASPGTPESFYIADNIQMLGSTEQNCDESSVTAPATHSIMNYSQKYPSIEDGPAKTVVFKQKNYNVSVDLLSNVPGKGTTTCSKDTAIKGEELTITATAASGYSLESLKVLTASGGRVALQSGYKFKMPAEDVIIEAVYSSNQGSGSGSGSSGSNNELIQLLLNGDIISAKAIANDSGKVKVSWNKIGMATGYEVYGDGKLLGTATTNSYVAPICAKYTVRAIVKFGGTNIYSNFSDPAKLVLAKNSITSLKSNAKKQFTVKFEKITGAQTYEVKYKAANGSWKVATAKSLTKTIKKLSSKKKYTVKVRGIYADGSVSAVSPWSATKTVKVK